MHFGRDEAGAYKRRPTRGLDLARVMYPEGGGLEFAWKLRLALEAEGVQLIDRLFITGLMRGGADRITGAVGINSRTGEFNVIKARATIVAHQRHHVPLGLRARHHRHRHAAGLSGRREPAQRRVQLRAAGHAEVLFRGHHLRDPGGRALGQRQGRGVHATSTSRTGATRPTCRASRAPWRWRTARATTPLYLDMSPIPEHLREYFIQSKVKWMDNFFRKLGDEAKTDMFGKTPYYALNQMTKMGIRTGADCRSDVPGLLSAGLAQAGCANHFAGFHIGLCVGNGWIAGKSAIEDLDRLPTPTLDAGRSPRAARRDQRAAEGRGQRGIRPHPARSAGRDVRLRHRHPQTRGPAAGGVRPRRGARRGVQGHRRAAHPRAGAPEGDRGDAARGALHPRRFALSHRVAAEPFPRGSRRARRRQLAGLGRRDRGRQRAGVQQDAGADAVLLGDAAAAEAVAPCGAGCRWPGV